MNLSRICIAIITLTIALPFWSIQLAAEEAAESAAGIQRFAFIIGVNDGGGDRITLRYAASDARTMANVMEDLGGIAPRNRLLLIDPGRTEILEGFKELESRMTGAKERGGRVELFFYYSGHSDDQGLLLFGRRLKYKDLKAGLKSLPADLRIVILDSCASGAITRTKGGKRTQPFLVDDSVQLKGHAYLASSAADEAAQESDAIGGSFFTHYLVSGLRGAADVTGDRRVTLNEAYHFAYTETLGRTETTQSGSQHATYDIELSGTGDLVLTELRDTSASLAFAGDIHGRLYIRDEEGRLVVEMSKSENQAVELALEPGRYRVILEQVEEYFMAEVILEMDSQYALQQSDFSKLDSESTVARGHAAEKKAYTSAPFNIGFFPPADVNKAYEDKRPLVNNVSLGVFASVQDKLEGVGIAGMGVSWQYDDMTGAHGAAFATVTEGDQTGLALSGFVNITYGDAIGVQASGFYNHTGRHFTGAQLAMVQYTGGNFTGAQGGLVNIAVGNVIGAQFGLSNWTTDHFKGAQLGLMNITHGNVTGLHYGLLNVTTGSFTGLEASLLNITTGKEESTGAQLGLMNVAVGKVKGLQLGLFNYCEESTASIGIISISKNGMLHGNFWTSDTAMINAGLKLGGKYIYNILSIGVQPFLGHTLSYGWGIGGRIPVLENFDIDIDIMQISQFRTSDAYDQGQISKLRLIFNWKVSDELSLIVGPTFNVISTRQRKKTDDSYLRASDLSYIPTNHVGSSDWSGPVKGGETNDISLGPGFILGIEI